MFDPITKIVNSPSGRVYSVPAAINDPYAAISLCFYDSVHGVMVADDLREHFSYQYVDFDVAHKQGIVSLTCVFPPDASMEVISGIKSILASARPPDSRTKSRYVKKLSSGVSNSKGLSFTRGVGPLIVAYSDNCSYTDSICTLLDGWPNDNQDASADRDVVRNGLELVSIPHTNSNLSKVNFGCPAPARNDPLYRSASLIAYYLSSSSGPIHARARRQGWAIYDIKCRVNPGLGTGWMSCEFLTKAKFCTYPVSFFRSEIRSLREQALPQRQINALSLRVVTRIARLVADNRGRCLNVIFSELYRLPINHHVHIKEGFMNLNGLDIQKAADAIDISKIVGIDETIRGM